MTCDHYYWPFFKDYPELRLIGRIAFPLYCLLLVEGFEHTKNDKKKAWSYIARLVIVGLISVIPFNLAFFGKPVFDVTMSIFTTLILSLLMLYSFEFIKKYNKYLCYFVILFFSIVSYFARGDYQILGPLLVFWIYVYRQNNDKVLFSLAFICTLLVNSLIRVLMLYNDFSLSTIANYYANVYPIEEFAIMALPIILLYNGKKGYSNKFIQYAFYLYYPAHLVVLYFLKQLV